MKESVMRIGTCSLLAVVGAMLAGPAAAAPALADPAAGTLALVVSDPVNLSRADGLAFDTFGNLFAARERTDSAAGVSWVNRETGTAISLVSGIWGADQIDIHPDGRLYVTSELPVPTGASYDACRLVAPASFCDGTDSRLFRATLSYDALNRPASATVASVTTGIGLNGPEGLVVLRSDGPYGNAGDLLVAEDATPGRVLKLDVAAAPAAVTVLTGTGANLHRPEGAALGDFGSAAPAALYVAETTDDNVLRIGADGAATVFGNPSAVGLNQPDNLEFGPDGFLYVSEDVAAGGGRIVRIAADGTHEVFAMGFSSPQGLAFDPANGDLYIAEQDASKIWRVHFASPVPEPGIAFEMIVGALAMLLLHRRRASRRVQG
ncbi:MAG TPA: hypothetical protein DHV08_13760 [Rhodocyclaceae bacterium]|nr:MAG: hypothetical protein AUK49_03055 [Betaproteobacteria bacterium CG2_30_68_42]PIX74873.1 MAG: hypothetical protein COZ38_08605 [Rhodocyclales bacterium CG_4_10_14_3_um_filter_68_10]PJA58441.1 MAG: hypothetical protein CO164_02570 [Rhodocyclales bacterium CG_4_9_14_3_um_filter_68_10]HCX34497.1 hypothetical protein [Rhodocyclaceae bacterium]